MRCHDAQRLSSDYLDGELAPDASAAVRGHLRTCPSCEGEFEKEAQLIEAAASLEALDPPDSVWEGIAAKLAEREVRDAQTFAPLRWIRWRIRPVAFGGALVLAAAAAGALLFWRADAERQTNSETASLASAQELQDPAQRTFEAERERELSESDRHYIDSIAELRELVEEDRAVWSDKEALAIDAQLASFHRGDLGARLALTNVAGGPDVDTHGRGALHAGYRAEISFLQSTLAGELPEIE